MENLLKIEGESLPLATSASGAGEILPSCENAGLFYDERSTGNLGFMTSNEAMSHRMFPSLKQNAINGCLISIGFDRGLDMLIGVPQLGQAYLLDYCRKTSLATCAVLEIGINHIRRCGDFKDVNDFIAYFAEDKIESTLGLLHETMTTDELALVRDALTTRYRDNPEKPLLMDYLKFKSQQKMYASWLSTPENLNQILTRRIMGHINIVCGDASGGPAVQKIAETLQKQRVPVSIVDLSNIDFYFDDAARSSFRNAFGITNRKASYPTLPIDSETIFIHTHNSSTGPHIPANISQDFPDLHSVFSSNFWGYFLVRSDYLRELVRAHPLESEAKILAHRGAGISLRGESYRNVIQDPHEVYLFGDFEIPDIALEVDHWGINEAALLKDPFRAIRSKNDAALSAEEQSLLSSIALQRKVLGYDTQEIQRACLLQAALIARVRSAAISEPDRGPPPAPLSKEEVQSVLVYTQLGIDACDDGNSDASLITAIAASLEDAGYADAALQVLEHVPIAEYLFWKPQYPPNSPVIQHAIDRNILLHDSDEAFTRKRGTPLTPDEYMLIKDVLSGSSGENYDKEKISSECLLQARHLVRIGTGALAELGSDYYSHRPSLEEAHAAVEYCSLAISYRSPNSTRLASIGGIAAALQCAEYPQAALSLLKLIAKEGDFGRDSSG